MLPRKGRFLTGQLLVGVLSRGKLGTLSVKIWVLPAAQPTRCDTLDRDRLTGLLVFVLAEHLEDLGLRSLQSTLVVDLCPHLLLLDCCPRLAITIEALLLDSLFDLLLHDDVVETINVSTLQVVLLQLLVECISGPVTLSHHAWVGMWLVPGLSSRVEVLLCRITHFSWCVDHLFANRAKVRDGDCWVVS